MTQQTLPGIHEAQATGLTTDALSDLAEMFSGSLSRNTRRAYAHDLRDCAGFLADHFGDPVDVDDADALGSAANYVASRMLNSMPGKANELALRYRTHLSARDLAPATINRRLAALRSLVKLARVVGLVTWSLEVRNVESRSYRDTRGPGVKGFRKMLGKIEKAEKAEKADTPKGARDRVRSARDRAILRLLWDLALRRAEITALDRRHVDLEAGRLSIKGKGRGEREALTLPAETRNALARWLEHRGDEPGPLFVNFDPTRKDDGLHRLSGTSVWRLVKDLGEEAGVKGARPHGVRHAAITHALDKTGGDVRSVSAFSRHRDVRVLMRYDDNRQDRGGEIAQLVSSAV